MQAKVKKICIGTIRHKRLKCIAPGMGCFILISIFSVLLCTGVTVHARGQTVLKIVLREFQQSRPVAGVKVEILSYGWQLEFGQPFAIIAEGETDTNGSVSFDTTIWPSSGYRFKFSPTTRTRPEGIYFLPDTDNQFRGYPGNTIEGSDAVQRGKPLQTLYFVLLTTGLVENDTSFGQGRPQYTQVVPEVGVGYNGSFKPVDGKSYVATAIAQTNIARAGGAPDPTRPLPPPPYTPGVKQLPLDITPTSEKMPTQSTNTIKGEGANPFPEGRSSTPAQVVSTTSTQPTQEPELGQRLVQTLLALIGIIFLILFIRFRHLLFRLVGLQVNYTLPKAKQKKPRRSSVSVFSVKSKKHLKLPAPARKVEGVELDIGKDEQDDQKEK